MSKALTPVKSRNKSSPIVAGAAGAGGGTLLVLLANNLPEGNALKPWLLIIAPTASVFLGALFLWGKERLIAFLKRRDLQAAIQEAKNTLEAALKNPATTELHKDALRNDLEKLEKLAVAAQMQRVQALVN